MPIDFFGWIYVLLGLAMLVGLVRLIRGPHLADRVVALDNVAFQLIALAVTHSCATGQVAFIEAGLVLASIAFLGTVAFARYIEQSATRR